jgi:hypothetical protein
MLRTWLVAGLLALPAHADTLSDLRTALAPLAGTSPIRARVTVERTRKSEGRFANQVSNATISYDATSDAEGIHLTFAPALLARAEQELREHEADTKKPQGIHNAIADIDTVGVAETLDFRGHLLRLLAIGQTVSETHTLYRGVQARVVTLKLTPKLAKEATSVFHVKFTEDRLTLWVAADGVPLGAERQQKGNAGFLFLRGDMSSHDLWTFSRTGDRLIVTRHENSFLGTGFGQRGEGRTVQTVAVR